MTDESRALNGTSVSPPPGLRQQGRRGGRKNVNLEEVGEVLLNLVFEAYLGPYTHKLKTGIMACIRLVDTGLLYFISWR